MYSIRLEARRTRRQLDALPPGLRRRVQAAIEALAEQPRPVGAIKLTGRFEGSWRLRVGDYRVVYEIDDAVQIVTITRVMHRSDVYEH